MRSHEARIPVKFLGVVAFAVFGSAILSASLVTFTTRRELRAVLARDSTRSMAAALPEGETAASVLSLCSTLVKNDDGGHLREKAGTGGEAAAAVAQPCPAAEECKPCPEAPAAPAAQACEPCPAGGGGGVGGGAATAAAVVKPSLISLPDDIKKVIINIGTNFNPIMPPEDDPTTAVIAVEPILETALKIKKHPRLFIIMCAIANGEGRFQTMHIHNVGGASSSLANPTNPNAFWVGTKKDGWPDFQIVPVMSMKTLLDSIPPTIQIIHLKTDMQGFDFAAVSSAGRSIRRIPEVYSEVYVNTASYEGVENDLNKHWDPHMKEMGYERVSTNTKKRGEDNALYKRIGEQEA